MDIVDAIRSTLRNSIHDREIIIDFAAEYAEECATLNQRLREISDLLRKGKRAEAISIAEQEPNALEVFSGLDFLELDSWIELLADLELEAPPLLLAELAAELDQAYNDEEKLEPLLKQHRILALRNGHLNQRINVLRKIIRVSSDNLLWKEDLQSYEKVRLKEINLEANQAVKTGDRNTLKGLHAELSEQWSVPVPERLQASVQNAYASLEVKEAQSKIKKINNKLNSALAELDAEEATRLRGKWEQTAPRAKLTEDHDLRLEVQEVFNWLDDEERNKQEELEFKHTLAEIETKIFQREPFDEVEQLYYLAERYEREIPVVLQNQFLTYRATHEVSRKRKFVTILTVTCLGILLLGTGVYFFFDAINYSGKKADALQELNVAIDAEDWKSAERIRDNLSERLKKEPEIQRRVSEVADKIKAENDRVNNLETVMTRLKDAPKDPPPTDLISQAQALAKTENEKQNIQNLKSAVEEFQQRLLGERNREIENQLDGWIQDLKSFESEKSPIQRAQSLAALLKTLREAKAANNRKYYDKPLISDSYLDRIDSLAKRCDSSLEKAKEATAYYSDIVELKTVAGDPSSRLVDYSQKSAWFIGKHPGKIESLQLKQNVQEFDLFNGWNKWAAFLKRPEWSQLDTINRNQADLVLADYKQLRKDHRENEPTAFINKGIDFLMLVKDVDVQADLSAVKTYLSSYAYNQLWVIEKKLSDNKFQKFYVPPNPNVEGEMARSQIYYTGFPRSDKDLGAQKKADLDRIVDFYPAPHSTLAKSLSNTIQRLPKKSSMDEVAIDLCKKCLNSGKNIDVIIKGIFLQKIIFSAVKSSKNMELLLQSELDELNKLKLDSANWLWETKASNLNSLRSSTEVVLSEIQNKLKNAKIVDDSKEKIAAAIPRQLPLLEWQGAVFQSENGDWELELRNRSLRDCKLYCIEEKNGKPTLSEVGSWDAKQKKAALDVSKMKTGRIIITMKVED